MCCFTTSHLIDLASSCKQHLTLFRAVFQLLQNFFFFVPVVLEIEEKQSRSGEKKYEKYSMLEVGLSTVRV